MLITLKSDIIDPNDFFDPRNWKEPEPCRIYLTDDLELFALVDAVDYPALCKYRWSSLGRQWKQGQKHDYARRSQSEFHAPDGPMYESPITGKMVRNRHRIQRTVFLHHVIAERAGLIKPTPKHLLDHRNGKPLDCRRKNLRWATRRFNMLNSNGRLEHVHDHEDPHSMLGVTGEPHDGLDGHFASHTDA